MRMGPHHMMPRDTEAVKDAKLARDTAGRVWTFARPYRPTIIVFLLSILVAALLAPETGPQAAVADQHGGRPVPDHLRQTRFQVDFKI